MGKGTCSIEGCELPERARGWCKKHYTLWHRHGDPLAKVARGTPVRAPAERFWPKVNKDGPVPEHRPDLGPCWIWTAGGDYGRGRFAVVGRSGRLLLAHRFAYELLIGPIPEGLTLDHLCMTPLCVNPEHLEPVTQAENSRRAAEAKRQLKGSRKPT